MQKRSVTVLLASVLAVCVLAIAPAAVYAEQGSSSHNDTTAEDSHNGNPGDETRTPRTTSHTQTTSETETNDSRSTDTRKHRFDTRKLQACNNRKDKITGVIDRVVQRTQNQLDLFDKITARTEAFYVSKGKTLSTYDELVAAVNAAKAQAETDLAAVTAHSTFACDADDPTGDVAAFKAAVKQEIQDLKAYRTAIKNLITGVKSVQGDA
ncbi:MAG TPA: hypothetical protein VLI54_07035 [Bacillota bacterium]|nr:hypothetical protein [Bacillota bacterium]